MFTKAKYVGATMKLLDGDSTDIKNALDEIRIRLQKLYGEKSNEYKLLKNKKNVSLLRKYSCDINWWVFTKRYKNDHMVDILRIVILDDLLKISNDLMEEILFKRRIFRYYSSL